MVKKNGSFKSLEAIAWGYSGKRLRSKSEVREGLLSVEDQVSTAAKYTVALSICSEADGYRIDHSVEFGLSKDRFITAQSQSQVDCLIDLATDPDVLGRQWIGLATWV